MLPRPVNIGQEWRRRVGACASTFPDHQRAHGTHLSRMTTTWMRVVLNIMQLLLVSLSFAVSSVFLCRGRKTAGGDTVSWVGFELLHRSYKIGLSPQWFQRWTRETADAGYVHMSAFEEDLGRVMYVAGALEFERPSLSPLCRFLTLHPRASVRRLPAYVVFILRYLADRIQESRHYDCAAELISSDLCPSG